MRRQRQSSRELAKARRVIEGWRHRRASKGERIPDEVWDAAVAAARVDGVWSTSRVLRLEFNRLKKRVGAASERAISRPATVSRRMSKAVARWVARRQPVAPDPAVPAFVEVAVEAPPQAGPGSKTVIELMGLRGGRMRIDVTGGSAVDVVALTQTFWGCQS